MSYVEIHQISWNSSSDFGNKWCEEKSNCLLLSLIVVWRLQWVII